MNIYVGNLSPQTTEDDLKQLFAEYGQVTSVKVIKDRFTYESRGFGFVEMPSKAEAQEAMQELNGSELDGNVLTVNEARPREERSGGGGGYGGGSGYGGGGGGRGGSRQGGRGGSGRRSY